MNIYIRTRGFSTDYHYIPEKSLRESELRQYENQSDLQYPTCILECTREKGAFLFLSGITSGRKDNQGTPIRYDLLLIIDPRNFNQFEYLTRLARMIEVWLDDVKSALTQIEEEGKSFDIVRIPKQSQSKLGKFLDETLSEEYLEDLFKLTLDNRQLPEKKRKELEKNFEDLTHNISEQKQSEDEPLKSPNNFKKWWGGINNEASCQRWLKLVRELLAGKVEGKALLLNIATSESLGSFLTQNQEIGVLLAKGCSRSQPQKFSAQQSPPAFFFANGRIGFILIGIILSLIFGYILIQPPNFLFNLTNQSKPTNPPDPAPPFDTDKLPNKSQLTKGDIVLKLEEVKDNQVKLTLTIEPVNEKQPNQICVFSVTKNNNVDSYYTLKGVREKRCTEISLAKYDQLNGTWSLEEFLTAEEPERKIEVRKIYNGSIPDKTSFAITTKKKTQES